MIRKLAHLCLITDQLPAMLDFYIGKLGLGRQFDFINSAGTVFGVFLSCGDTTFIEIFDRVGRSKHWNIQLEPMIKGLQMHHLCFEVTALKEFRQKLIDAGVKMSDPVSGMTRALASWTEDPDGNPIEFMEYLSTTTVIGPPQLK